jgi:hypothetical protein
MKTNLERIITALGIRRDNLDAAIAALSGHEPIRQRPGRPRAIPASVREPKRKRRLSAAARKKMSEAMRARWAEAKESGKNAL